MATDEKSVEIDGDTFVRGTVPRSVTWGMRHYQWRDRDGKLESRRTAVDADDWSAESDILSPYTPRIREAITRLWPRGVVKIHGGEVYEDGFGGIWRRDGENIGSNDPSQPRIWQSTPVTDRTRPVIKALRPDWLRPGIIEIDEHYCARGAPTSAPVPALPEVFQDIDGQIWRRCPNGELQEAAAGFRLRKVADRIEFTAQRDDDGAVWKTAANCWHRIIQALAPEWLTVAPTPAPEPARDPLAWQFKAEPAAIDLDRILRESLAAGSIQVEIEIDGQRTRFTHRSMWQDAWRSAGGKGPHRWFVDPRYPDWLDCLPPLAEIREKLAARASEKKTVVKVRGSR